MNNYFVLAWRNLWRNKRRTLITIASIFFGVIISTFMSSMQEGSYSQYISAIVNSYSGFIQVHKNGYWEDKDINNSFEYDNSLKEKISKVKQITVSSPRLETYALGSVKDITRGVMVIGIQPDQENRITNLSGKIIRGRYLDNGDTGIIIGSSLAKYLKLRINDTLILIGQGYHGSMAAGKYPVCGIIRHPSPEFDRMAVYMDIGNCQNLFSAQGLITSLVIMVKSGRDLNTVKHLLVRMLGSKYEVMDWKELNRMLMKQIESDRASGIIIKGVLYMIVAFGILSTIIMMMAERRKEFGVLMAIGMRKYKLIFILILELVLLGLTGVFSGILCSVPVVLYFLYHPIPLTGQAGEMMTQMGFEPAMHFSVMPGIFYNQALTILIFTFLIGIYPILNIRRLKVNIALRIL